MSTRLLSEFDLAVYAAVRRIPSGTVASYGLIAKSIGMPKHSRQVGSTMSKNPFAPGLPQNIELPKEEIVNCHRVVKSDRTLGGFFGSAENSQKAELLRKEGVKISGGKVDKIHMLLRLPGEFDP
jgi:O-6-methylguanine DNA methyltransferase